LAAERRKMRNGRKHISVIGIGKLGLCFALCLERAGHHVLGYDINRELVDGINDKKVNSLEPQVNELLASSKNFKATAFLGDAIWDADINYVFVNTPSDKNGKFEHSNIDSIMDELKVYGRNSNLFVIASTVMPGYCEDAQETLQNLGYNVAYNPLFIVQGAIVKGITNSSIVLVGGDEKAKSQIIDLHSSFLESDPQFLKTSLIESEIIKIGINCYVTMKISFANMIGAFCKKTSKNINVNTVLKNIGSDERIGEKAFGYGYGFGGPCFPRDNRALAYASHAVGVDPKICKAVNEQNDEHLKNQLDLIEHGILPDNISLDRGTGGYKIDGVTYKKGTNILEESQPLKLALMLAGKGNSITIIEEAGVIEELKKLYPHKFNYDVYKV
jgi:nucleotide sugar dehydrogenase